MILTHTNTFFFVPKRSLSLRHTKINKKKEKIYNYDDKKKQKISFASPKEKKPFTMDGGGNIMSIVQTGSDQQ